ncbi:MAG: hypothetical protein AVDCRST_MAG90-416 [uncultured Microvirga sp.]|uniref:Uncharacterized protein n=1 Tax=uncultured Microvirga sp. TaxID=412392 RepID=A0A6J4KNC5_9HYPH|nr:MAG: hypothetical protein AVDCRST_MAG90-416 [uncultured Microvirga sp.]
MQPQPQTQRRSSFFSQYFEMAARRETIARRKPSKASSRS